MFQEISGGTETIVMGGRNIAARAYVARFNFKGPDQEKKVGNLSGRRTESRPLGQTASTGLQRVAVGRADQ